MWSTRRSVEGYYAYREGGKAITIVIGSNEDEMCLPITLSLLISPFNQTSTGLTP